MKPRGAPELVYGRDGHPLVVTIESDMDDLRGAVGQLGRYRLDPVADDGKIADGVPAAYVQVTKPEHAASASPMFAPQGDSAICEAMRLNTDLAKSVIEQFPAMMTSAAELLRAADGAGIPARTPRVIDIGDRDDDEDDDTQGSATSPTFELINTLVAQIVPVIVSSFAGKKLPSIGEMLDWRKASPQVKPASELAPGASAVPSAEPAPVAIPPIDPATMAKVLAIQSTLAPEEVARVRQLAAELSPTELRAWFAELSALSVPDAVAKVRAIVGTTTKTGGAS
jgi:hypothetical protein